MKRWIAALLLSLLLLGVGSCVKGPAENEVVFWHAMGRWEKVLNELVDEFNALHPEMTVRAYNMSRYQALSQKLIAAVAAGQPPTICQAYPAWVAELIDAEIVECLQPYADGPTGFGQEDWDDFQPVFIDESRYGGDLWSFPFNKSIRALFTNRDFFSAHGFDPDSIPRDWDRWREMSLAMSSDLDGDGRNDTWGVTAKSSVTFFGNLLLQNGGDFFSEDGARSTIAEPEGIEALEFMWDLLGTREMGYSTFDYAYQNEFKAGRVGMMESSTVSLSFLRGHIEFGLGVWPLPGKVKDTALIQGTNLVIFRKATEAQKQTAWEFIRFLTNTRNATRWSVATGYAPVRKSCLAEPEMQELVADTPGLAETYGQLPRARSEPRNAAWFAGRKYLEEGAIQRVMRGTARPEAALRRTADKIDDEIASDF